MSPNDFQQKLRRLLRLGLSPSSNPHEAANAIERAKHIADAHDFDLTRFLDEVAANPSFGFDVNAGVDVTTKQTDARFGIGQYLGQMTTLLEQATALSLRLSCLQTAAAEDPDLFYDQEWQSQLQEILDSMNAVPEAMRATTPPESAIHIHLVYLRIALVYRIRAIHVTNALQCLKSYDLPGAGSAFGNASESAHTLSQMGDDLANALNQRPNPANG